MNGVFLLSLYTAQKEHVVLDHVGTMLAVYGAHVGPMLIHVRLLEALLGHIRAMLSLC